MKVLDVSHISEAVRKLCIQVNTDLPQDVEEALRTATKQEKSPFGQYILEQIVENASLARREHQAMCQDTGLAVVYLDIGQDLHLVGGDVGVAIQDGVRRGYCEGYLRASMVSDPLFERKNTTDNTPAVIHYRIVPGDCCKITLMPKGGGAENMGAVRMLTPSMGETGVFDFVVDTVRQAGGNPCPPIVVGVGIGGTMEKVTALAKEALLRPLGMSHPDERYAALENKLLKAINATGIGPQGLGGRITALAVHIETFPAHIAMLPVAVNLNCHAARHQSVVLEGILRDEKCDIAYDAP